ncbi:hypothetical protein AB6A40_011160 [Gnathostoma spinigerum]|uniref:Uncharacterized protein n=1 Tax=Gnathostoma spinigerum TaxID=75299 RepID=A0ABD6EYL7_9BILA
MYFKADHGSVRYRQCLIANVIEPNHCLDRCYAVELTSSFMKYTLTESYRIEKCHHEKEACAVFFNNTYHHYFGLQLANGVKLSHYLTNVVSSRSTL